jgi:CspA family cold shock protein
MNERETGTVKWFSEEKGYGFIARDRGDDDIFVHASDILGAGVGGFTALKEGQRVEFGVERTSKGVKAVLVTVE